MLYIPDSVYSIYDVCKIHSFRLSYNFKIENGVRE